MLIRLRKAKLIDCKLLFSWLNEPATRKASLNTCRIPFAVHYKWLASSLKNPSRHIFIAEHKVLGSIGQVRIDEINEQAMEFDITVSPNERGKGFGTELIKHACRIFEAKRKKGIFIARIKKKNIASIRAFEKAGFFKLLDYSDANYGTLVILGRAKP